MQDLTPSCAVALRRNADGSLMVRYGAGDDVLSGGLGNDTYVLAYNSGHDSIIESAVAEPDAANTIPLDAAEIDGRASRTRCRCEAQSRRRRTAEFAIRRSINVPPPPSGGIQDSFQ